MTDQPQPNLPEGDKSKEEFKKLLKKYSNSYEEQQAFMAGYVAQPTPINPSEPEGKSKSQIVDKVFRAAKIDPNKTKDLALIIELMHMAMDRYADQEVKKATKMKQDEIAVLIGTKDDLIAQLEQKGKGWPSDEEISKEFLKLYNDHQRNGFIWAVSFIRKSLSPEGGGWSDEDMWEAWKECAVDYYNPKPSRELFDTWLSTYKKKNKN